MTDLSGFKPTRWFYRSDPLVAVLVLVMTIHLGWPGFWLGLGAFVAGLAVRWGLSSWLDRRDRRKRDQQILASWTAAMGAELNRNTIRFLRDPALNEAAAWTRAEEIRQQTVRRTREQGLPDPPDPYKPEDFEG